MAYRCVRTVMHVTHFTCGINWAHPSLRPHVARQKNVRFSTRERTRNFVLLIRFSLVAIAELIKRFSQSNMICDLHIERGKKKEYKTHHECNKTECWSCWTCPHVSSKLYRSTTAVWFCKIFLLLVRYFSLGCKCNVERKLYVYI